MNFNIDWKKLADWLIPSLLRKGVMMLWVRSLLRPIIDVHQSFLRYKKEKDYQLGITGQVCYLEKMLRDKYDFTLRRIWIDDAQDKPISYIYNRQEAKPLFVRKRSEAMPKIIYTRNENGLLANDFIVWVPMNIVFDFQEMGSLIMAYKLPGVKFKIQRY
jgi:hypothetical protein